MDVIKCDDIAREMPKEETELCMLSDSLLNCGRDMIFSISPGPAPLERAELFKQTANMWRITDDFWDNWDLLYNMFERCEKWCTHTGAGRWPDADMLPIGAIKQDYDKSIRTNFTKDEQITMLTLWSIFRSPLIIGGEMTSFDDFTMSLITNADILKMHSDARNSHQVWKKNFNGTEHILWKANDDMGKTYIAVFNTGHKADSISIPLSDIEIYSPIKAKELWSGEEVSCENEISVSLESHGAKAFYLW